LHWFADRNPPKREAMGRPVVDCPTGLPERFDVDVPISLGKVNGHEMHTSEAYGRGTRGGVIGKGKSRGRIVPLILRLRT
jgi:hypothetical protein